MLEYNIWKVQKILAQDFSNGDLGLTLAFLWQGQICFRVLLYGKMLISSPEHEVLMVSYCDQSLSVVRRPSCVVRRLSSTICFKS